MNLEKVYTMSVPVYYNESTNTYAGAVFFPESGAVIIAKASELDELDNNMIDNILDYLNYGKSEHNVRC